MPKPKSKSPSAPSAPSAVSKLQCDHGEWQPIAQAALTEVLTYFNGALRLTKRQRLLIELGISAGMRQILHEARASTKNKPISLAE